ncbi:MAG: type II secretion system F family protein [Gemmataceae bacterium]
MSVFGKSLSPGAIARWCTQARQYHDAGFSLEQTCRKLGYRNSTAIQQFSTHLANQMAAGESLTDGLRSWPGTMPPLVAPLLEAGESTGRIVEALDALADSMTRQDKSQKETARRMAWPLMQLALACGIMILLTVVMGLLPGAKNSGFDPLGFGLSGFSGGLKLLGFVAVLGLILAVVVVFLWKARHSSFWLSIPLLGTARQLLARSRFGEALGITVGAGLGPRKSLALAVRAADLAPWSDRLQEGQARLRGGRSWQRVLEDWPYLGADWLAILSVGEESGQIAEALVRQSKVDAEEGARNLARAVSLGAGAAWLTSAGFVIFLIFRIFGSYLNALGV